MTATQAKASSWLKLLLPLGLLVLAGWVAVNRQMLHDKLILWQYEPPARIKRLAEKADLSRQGKIRFFVNKPELHGKATFGRVCGDAAEEGANVLGCFTGSRIYIYNVPAASEKLNGIEEVTAAHEMLHAAYSRLSSDEKRYVQGLIRRQKKRYLAPHVKKTLQAYKDLGPERLLNELHSILGTEQRRLIPELEQYYDQYFTDRSTVVSLAEDYREVFDSLRQKQKRLAGRLEQLAKKIDRSTKQINHRIAAYNAAVEDFNQDARSGRMSLAEYERRKAKLTAELAAIKDAIAHNEAMRATYERLRGKYHSLALQLTELHHKVNSSAPKL